MWSKDVAAGDEIGWDFVNRVLSSKMSFSSFCADTTRIYISTHPCSAHFMSKTTFVSWFFAWCGKMDIDFRKHIDPWCLHNPHSLAGDGTHIGVSFRNISISPIEKADTNIKRKPIHKRYARVFLPYNDGNDELVRSARQHVRDTSKRYLSREAPLIDAATKANEDQNLLDVCPQDPRCKDFIASFLNALPASYKQALAELFLVLSSDASVTTVIPHRYQADVLALANAALTNGHIPFEPFLEFSPELGHAFQESAKHNKHQLFATFLLYLIDFINGVHDDDIPYAPAIPIMNTYNPEAGVAYYFTPHGNVLRQFPVYEVNSSTNAIFDDDPCKEQRCGKKFGKVSLGGWAYLFLWFCPVHGHCYGFHIIQVSVYFLNAYVR